MSELWMSDICCQVIGRSLDNTIWSLWFHQNFFCSDKKHSIHIHLFHKSWTFLPLHWLNLGQYSCSSVSVLKEGPYEASHFLSCEFMRQGTLWRAMFYYQIMIFLDGNISLKKHRVYLSWQVPFHLPIDPRCLVNLLLKLQSTPYSESSVVQLCICPKLQTKYLAAITLQYMY